MKAVKHKLSFSFCTTQNKNKLLEETDKFMADEVISKLSMKQSLTKSTELLFSACGKGGLNLLLPSDRVCEKARSIEMYAPLSEKGVVAAE